MGVEDPSYWNLAQFRLARKRAIKGSTGIWPKTDRRGQLVIYVMHRNLHKLQILCSKYIECPGHFIRAQKKKRYGYFYVRLFDFYAAKWLKKMERDSSWKKV